MIYVHRNSCTVDPFFKDKVNNLTNGKQTTPIIEESVFRHTKVHQDDILIIGNYTSTPSGFIFGHEPSHTDYAMHEKDVIELTLLFTKARASVIGIGYGAALLSYIAGAKVLKREQGPFIEDDMLPETSYCFDIWHNNFSHDIKGIHMSPDSRVRMVSHHSFLIYPFDLDRKDYRIIAYADALPIKKDEYSQVNYGHPSNYGKESSPWLTAFSNGDFFSFLGDYDGAKALFGGVGAVDPEIIHFPDYNFLAITEASAGFKEPNYSDYLKNIYDKFEKSIL